MLVLSRKYDEKIMIGKDIVITVLKINGENVSLGIQAPRSMSIYREEVFLEIEKENKQGAIQPENVDIESIAKSLNLAKNSDNKPVKKSYTQKRAPSFRVFVKEKANV